MGGWVGGRGQAEATSSVGWPPCCLCWHQQRHWHCSGDGMMLLCFLAPPPYPAGEASDKLEQRTAAEAGQRVMRVLRGIYEPRGIEVPAPLQASLRPLGWPGQARAGQGRAGGARPGCTGAGRRAWAGLPSGLCCPPQAPERGTAVCHGRPPRLPPAGDDHAVGQRPLCLRLLLLNACGHPGGPRLRYPGGEPGRQGGSLCCAVLCTCCVRWLQACSREPRPQPLPLPCLPTALATAGCCAPPPGAETHRVCLPACVAVCVTLRVTVCGRVWLLAQVFFAGEATTRKYPATMHGAFVSGLEVVRRQLLLVVLVCRRVCSSRERHPGLRLAVRLFRAIQCPPSSARCPLAPAACAGRQPRCDPQAGAGSDSRQSTITAAWTSSDSIP